MTKQERKDLKRIGDLFRTMVDGASTAPVREQAREKLEALLKKLGKAWSDLSGLLAQERQAEEEEKTERAAAQGATYNPQNGEEVKPAEYPCIDLVHGVLARYLDLKDHELVALTLWALHTPFYDSYMVTPRLAVLSPVADCGKTTLLLILQYLASRPVKMDNPTAASIYRLLDQRPRSTLLLDEMDNADLVHSHLMRTVINSGYQQGGAVPRTVNGKTKLFPTHAPMALAAINQGQPLPYPTLSRSIILNLQRSRKRLERLDPKNTGDLDFVRKQVWLWARPDLKLNPDPAMPKGLRVGRPQDKWRVLFAIADAFGPTWGQLARDAALTFARNQREEETSIQLLEDIREIFASLSADRLLSKTLVEHLRDLADSPWADLPLTEARLAKMLEPYGIKPKQIWPKGKRTKQRRGYLRSAFEEAWRSYCYEEEEEAAATKTAKILRLRSD